MLPHFCSYVFYSHTIGVDHTNDIKFTCTLLLSIGLPTTTAKHSHQHRNNLPLVPVLRLMCVVGDDWTSAVQHKSHLLMSTFTNDTDNVRKRQITYNTKCHNNISDVMTGYSESLRLRSDGCSVSLRKAITV